MRRRTRYSVSPGREQSVEIRLQLCPPCHASQSLPSLAPGTRDGGLVEVVATGEDAGALVLFLYGVIPTLEPAHFGRV